MPDRGPKPRTVRNSPPRPSGTVPISEIEPTSALNPEALAEFRRLVAVLDNRGTLDRIDLAIVTECARIKDLLDQNHKLLSITMDPKTVAIVTQLTSQRRGLLREMALTMTPSRSVVKTVARSNADDAGDPMARLVKLRIE